MKRNNENDIQRHKLTPKYTEPAMVKASVKRLSGSTAFLCLLAERIAMTAYWTASRKLLTMSRISKVCIVSNVRSLVV